MLELTPVMIVQFDATIDDLVDVSMRSSADSKTMRLWRWQGAALTGLLVGFPAYILFTGTTVVRFGIACGAGIVGVALHIWTYRESFRERLHKLVREQIGTDRPFTVTVELLDTGISFRQMG